MLNCHQRRLRFECAAPGGAAGPVLAMTLRLLSPFGLSLRPSDLHVQVNRLSPGLSTTVAGFAHDDRRMRRLAHSVKRVSFPLPVLSRNGTVLNSVGLRTTKPLSAPGGKWLCSRETRTEQITGSGPQATIK